MILTPECPVCGALPAFVLDDGHQCFCPDDRCQVLAWDSHQSREWLLANPHEMATPDTTGTHRRKDTPTW